MIKAVMNWLRSGRHRVTAAILLTVLLAWAYDSFASDNPVPIDKRGDVWTFLMPNGEVRMCGRITKDEVQCATKDEKFYVCDYRDEPHFFSGCREGIHEALID